MRSSLSAALLFAAATTPLAAQGFAGTIEARVLTETTPPQYLRWTISGDRWALHLTDEGDQIASIRVLFDRATREQWEVPFIDGKRIGSLPLPVPDTIPMLPTPMLQQRPGTQTIAGQACQEYGFEADGFRLTGCFTATLGRFMAPRLRGPLAIPAAPGTTPFFLGLPGWALAMSESELFPLKVWDANGQVLMEVKRVTAGGLPECFYEVPATIPGTGNPAFAVSSNTMIRNPDGRNQLTMTLRDGKQVAMMVPPAPPVVRGARPAPPPSCRPPAGRGRGRP